MVDLHASLLAWRYPGRPQTEQFYKSEGSGSGRGGRSEKSSRECLPDLVLSQGLRQPAHWFLSFPEEKRTRVEPRVRLGGPDGVLRVIVRIRGFRGRQSNI